MLALFGAGAYGHRRWRTWARGISMVAVAADLTYLVFFAGESWSFPVSTVLLRILVLLLNLFLFGAAWWIGDVWRSRREREMELKERTVQLVHEREENARPPGRAR
jgi:membrane protein DedA with SNARE-associated domain